eukprot:1138560-Pleurochrysis_carterae.AAC.1
MTSRTAALALPYCAVSSNPSLLFEHAALLKWSMQHHFRSGPAEWVEGLTPAVPATRFERRTLATRCAVCLSIRVSRRVCAQHGARRAAPFIIFQLLRVGCLQASSTALAASTCATTPAARSSPRRRRQSFSTATQPRPLRRTRRATHGAPALLSKS